MTYQQQSAPPSGWYPDPVSPGVVRWWTGTAWSEHRAPAAAPAPTPVVVVAAPPSGPNHLIHLILTLLSCGLWAPVWLLVAWQNSPRAGGATAGPWSTGRTIAVVGGVLVLAALAGLSGVR